MRAQSGETSVVFAALLAALLAAAAGCGQLVGTEDVLDVVAAERPAAEGAQEAEEAEEVDSPEAPTDSSTGKGAVTILIDSAEQVVNGKDAWDGKADCSATVRLSRNDKGITVIVDVVDDTISTKAEAGHENDSVELYFDVRPDDSRGQGVYEIGVFQMIVVPGLASEARSVGASPDVSDSARVDGSSGRPDGAALRVSWHQSGTGAYSDWVEVPGAKAVSRMLQDGYQVEVFLPQEGFAKNHHPPGETFNFAVGINDSDGDTRDSQLMSSGTNENWTDPSGFSPVSPKR